MTNDRRHGLRALFKGDLGLWGIYFFFILITIVEGFSASGQEIYKSGDMMPIVKHIGIVVLATIVALATSRLNWRFIKNMHFWLYGIAILLAFITMLKGKTANGAQRWINFLGISIQPSEILKMAILLIGAYFLGAPIRMPRRQAFWSFVVLTLISVMLIVSQSGSTSILIILFAWVLCFIGNAPTKDFLKLTGVGLFFVLLLVIFLPRLPNSMLEHMGRAKTWLARMESDYGGLTKEEYYTLSPQERDQLKYRITDDNLQKNYAKIAIARGGTTPIGVLPGNSRGRDYLPESKNDFIYAIIIEEWGPILGVLGVPILYLFFFFRIGAWGKRAIRKQQRLILYGFGMLFTAQALLNLSVASGLAPVTGQTLPLISKGGSSYLAMAFGFGLTVALTRIIKKENALLAQRNALERQAITADSTENAIAEEDQTEEKGE